MTIAKNSIYHESCVRTLERMPDDYLDMTLTSPPYDDLRAYNGDTLPLSDVIPLLYAKTKPGGVVIWITGDKTEGGTESLTSFRTAIAFRDAGFLLHDTMIYEKANPIPNDPGRRYRQAFEFMFCFSKGTPKTFNPITEPTKSAGKKIQAFRVTQNGRGNYTPPPKAEATTKGTRRVSNVFTYVVGSSAASDRMAFKHPAIFPEKLAADQISTWSNPGDVVFDCCMGSGTTAVVAKRLGRDFIGAEIAGEYVKLANERLRAAFAGKVAA